MAFRVSGMGLVVVRVAMLWANAMAQSGCATVLIDMAPCLNYITGSSSSPSSSCCSQLASVVQSQLQCLCAALNGGGSALGVTISQTLALALPVVCSVQTPPVSQCDAADEPVTPPSMASPSGSPEGSPGLSSNEIPEFPTSSSVPGIYIQGRVDLKQCHPMVGIPQMISPQLIAILLFMA